MENIPQAQSSNCCETHDEERKGRWMLGEMKECVLAVKRVYGVKRDEEYFGRKAP